MTYEESKKYYEAKESLKYLISEDCGDCQFDFINEVHLAIEALGKMSAIKDGLDSLKEDLQEAYKLNDAILSYVLKGNAMSELECRAEEFSLMMMQDLSWLVGIIEGVE